MLTVSIDGACHNNGKSDCVSAGGCFFMSQSNPEAPQVFYTKSGFEKNSTNQRGEMTALLLALETIAKQSDPDVSIITDSEYLFNTISKGWLVNWPYKKWVTSLGTTVKNKDLWEKILAVKNNCEEKGIEITSAIHHIKGHCMTIGTMTAEEALQRDPTGETLMRLLMGKYSTIKDSTIDIAQQLSLKNNQFLLAPKILKRFIIMNMVADRVATSCVKKAQALQM